MSTQITTPAEFPQAMLTWISLFFHVHCFDVLIQIAFLTELLQTMITLKLVFVVYSFYVHTKAFLAAKLLLALVPLNWLTMRVANVRTQTVLVAELFQALIALFFFNINVNSTLMSTAPSSPSFISSEA